MEYCLIMKVPEEERLVTKNCLLYVKKRGKTKEAFFRNINAKRDWGHARTIVMQCGEYFSKKPDDYVIATGVQYSIKQFIKTLQKN